MPGPVVFGRAQEAGEVEGVGPGIADPSLARESMEALDALTGILDIGSVYDFQGATVFPSSLHRGD